MAYLLSNIKYNELGIKQLSQEYVGEFQFSKLLKNPNYTITRSRNMKYSTRYGCVPVPSKSLKKLLCLNPITRALVVRKLMACIHRPTDHPCEGDRLRLFI